MNTPLASATSPKIHFDSTIFNFGKVMTGEIVKHDFYFTNAGSAELVLSAVQPQCGCTTAGDWTRHVPPGGTGVIPVQFNTINYDTSVSKGVTVSCNDQAQPAVTLHLNGTVWKAIDIFPTTVSLRLLSKEPFASGSIRITNTLDQPLQLSSPECTNHFFGAQLKTNHPGKEYFVLISNTVAVSGREMPPQVSTVAMKTSLTNMPVLSLMAFAQITPDLTVFPRQQLTLPAPPIPTNQLNRYVLIVNNSTNPISLSDVGITPPDSRVSVQVRQEGSKFNITLGFPPEFEATPGERLFFTAKTSNPDFPNIKLPINQSKLPEPKVEAAARSPRKAPPVTTTAGAAAR